MNYVDVDICNDDDDHNADDECGAQQKARDTKPLAVQLCIDCCHNQSGSTLSLSYTGIHLSTNVIYVHNIA